MKKLIKLSDTHYIVVDDSEMKENDYRFNISRKYYKQVDKEGVEYYNKRNDVFKKITHSTEPLEVITSLPDIGNGEVTELNYDKIKPISLSEVEEAINGHSVKTLAKDKLFTVDDMRKAYTHGIAVGNADVEPDFNSFIQSLLPKTEWEVKFNEQGKLELV